MKIHESVAPLLRGIGLTVVLLGTIAGALAAKTQASAKPVPQSTHTAPGSTNSPRDNSLDALTHEIEELRETVQEETIVEDVLTNPWFEILGIAGSGITASSFYVEWLSKRPKAGL